MTIDFVWQGSSNKEVFQHWNDGLRAAMRIIEQTHTVNYKEPWDELDGDIILYWEAPCSAHGANASHYNAIRRSDKKKILLFAGGPIEYLDAVGFDLYLVESEINEKEFEALELPWMRAFGVNTQIMKPEKQPKVFDGMFAATCASWKRLDLFSQALGSKGVVCGRYQENDRMPFEHVRNNGTLLLPELKQEGVAALLNASYVHVNTSAYWGGGQRSLLEALACGIPAIAMSDSPKNSEYILESGAGLICDPAPEAIRSAIFTIKSDYENYASKALPYIQSKWTEQIYANNILKAIEIVCS